jgi:predicted alpha/beta-hydrolase family hydrolase
VRRVVRFAVGDEKTSAALVAPPRARTLLVLGHGAGGDRSQDSIVRLQDALTPHVGTIAFNFLYREKGKGFPDRMPRLEATYRAALEYARARKPERLLAGGRSMGGRVASHLAAAGEPLDGLVLLGYPLHAAGKPEKLRTEHLPRIRCPVLFVSGTRDELAPRELLTETASRMGARLELIEGAEHGLDGYADEVAALILDWLGGLA